MTRYQPESGLRALVVEDHRVSRRYVTEALRRCGWTVKHCGNAEQALALYDAWQPLLVITDLHLPGADGFELAETLARRPPGNRHKPSLLLISAHTSHTLEKRARAAGFECLLRKPVKFSQFRKVLANLVSERKFRVNESQPKNGPQSGPGPRSRRDLLELFRAELREQLPELEGHLIEGRLAKAGSVVHQLTASAAICGNGLLEHHLRQLESAFRQPQDHSRLAGAFTGFHRCARTLLDEPEVSGSG